MNRFISKKITIIPEEKRLSRDIISIYELSNAVAQGISRIYETGETYLTERELYVDIVNLNNNDKKNIRQSEVVSFEDKEYVKLTSSRDIAKMELNKNKCPMSILRIIEETDTEIIAELVEINNLAKPGLECWTGMKY